MALTMIQHQHRLQSPPPSLRQWPLRLTIQNSDRRPAAATTAAILNKVAAFFDPESMK
jgi:hypothetical protein